MEQFELEMVEKERVFFQKRIDLLRKEYKYYDQFHFDENLGNALSHLISIVEGNEYVCAKVVREIPEHEKLVPFQDQLVKKRISKKKHSYLVVMENSFYELMTGLEFEDFSDMEAFMQSSSLFYAEYFGIFDFKTFQQRFSYLNSFFHYLNEWRFKTGRVTFDGFILDDAIERYLNFFIDHSQVVRH